MKQFGDHRADAGPRREEGDHKKITAAVFQRLAVMAFVIVVEMLGGAAQVPRAHSRGERAALDLSETLHLQRADEGNKGVHRGVVSLRHEGRRGEHGELNQDDDLPPVEGAVTAKAALYHLRDDYSDKKGEDRHQIIFGRDEISLEEIYPEEDDIAGLRVGKDAAARHVGIGVEKTARKREQHRHPQ